MFVYIEITASNLIKEQELNILVLRTMTVFLLWSQNIKRHQKYVIILNHLHINNLR